MFTDYNLIRTCDLARTVVLQSAGTSRAVGYAMEISSDSLSEAPGLPTFGQLMNCSCHHTHCCHSMHCSCHHKHRSSHSQTPPTQEAITMRFGTAPEPVPGVSISSFKIIDGTCCESMVMREASSKKRQGVRSEPAVPLHSLTPSLAPLIHDGQVNNLLTFKRNRLAEERTAEGRAQPPIEDLAAKLAPVRALDPDSVAKRTRHWPPSHGSFAGKSRRCRGIERLDGSSRFAGEITTDDLQAEISKLSIVDILCHCCKSHASKMPIYNAARHSAIRIHAV